MTLEETLTTELSTVAGSVQAPPPPVAELVRRGEQARRSRTVRLVAITLATAAAIVAAGLATGVSGKLSSAPVTPSGTMTHGPVPTGPPPQIPYVDYHRLYLEGDAQPGLWSSVVSSGRTAVAEPYLPGKARIFRGQEQIGEIPPDGLDVFFSPDSNVLAWTERSGTAAYIVVWSATSRRELGRLPVATMTLDNDDESVEHLAGVSDDGTVTYGGVLAGHRWKPGTAPVDTPVLLDDSPKGFPGDVAGVVVDPTGTWGAWATDRTGQDPAEMPGDGSYTGVTFQRPHEPASRFVIALPDGADVGSLLWESASNLLVQVYDDPDAVQSHFLRCSITTRQCEHAPTSPGG
ncbi:MAG: hypothetical protein ACJ72D_08730 [Marmoricola sp.]